MNLKVFGIFPLITLLLACQAHPEYGSVFNPQSFEIVPKDKARIIIYKRGINTVNDYGGSHIELSLNGDKVADLDECSFTYMDVQEGKHKLTASVPFLETPVNAFHVFTDKHIEQVFSAGKLYFANYEIHAQPMQYYVNDRVQKFDKVVFDIRVPAVAERELLGCRRMVSY